MQKRNVKSEYTYIIVLVFNIIEYEIGSNIL